MKKNEEEIKLVKDWLSFARKNLSFARSGIKEDYVTVAPSFDIAQPEINVINTIQFCCGG